MDGGIVTVITAGLIKELREKTGVGMAKCKQALTEASGDLEQAVVILRKAGMASAAKKEGREVKEGAIGFAENESTLALVEVNSETDFVANNEIFQDFLQAMANEVLNSKPASAEALSGQQYSGDPELTVDQYRSIIIQKVGENIQIRRSLTIEKGSNSSFGVYAHMGSKIVAVVELAGSSEEAGLARDIAMHVAAARPLYLNSEAVPESVRAQELEIARDQVKGKPEHIMGKILEGKMRAFDDEVCLTCQKYVRDDKLTIQELVDARSKETGTPLTLASYTCWRLGE